MAHFDFNRHYGSTLLFLSVCVAVCVTGTDGVMFGLYGVT